MILIKQYLYNIAVCLSQLFSTILFGEPDVSLSQRTAEAYLYHGERSWWKYQMSIIDSIIFWEDNHCLNSLKGEKNSRTIWRWDK